MNLNLHDQPRPADGRIRAAMVSSAMAVAGITAARHREAFVALLGAVNGTWDLTHTSTCGLVVRGLLRRLGALMLIRGRDWIRAPYGSADAPIGSVMTDLEMAAHISGAWRGPGPSKNRRPTPGDILFVAPPEHVCIVTGYRDGCGVEYLHSVDGGQVEEGMQAIHECARVWTGTQCGDRKVRGWIDLEGISWDSGHRMLAPAGWDRSLSE
jgi:hypothetical protein